MEKEIVMLPIYLCEDVVNQLIYLEKLISNYILKEALALYSSIGNTVQKTLTLKIGSRYIYVPIQNIYCIKANEHKLLLMTDYSSYEFYDTLQNILLRLDSSFLLCHKSCIVNLRYIMELDK